jgi:hypothetical protein
MTVIHLIHITCWPYHFTIDPFTRSNCCIKNFVKVFFRKVFWSCKPASKLCQRTLIDVRFDGIEIPSYCSGSFEWLWWELTNQTFFRNHFICLWIYRPTVAWDKNIDQTLTHFDRGNRTSLIKFSLSTFPSKTVDQIIDEYFDHVNGRIEKIIVAMN